MYFEKIEKFFPPEFKSTSEECINDLQKTLLIITAKMLKKSKDPSLTVLFSAICTANLLKKSYLETLETIKIFPEKEELCDFLSTTLDLLKEEIFSDFEGAPEFSTRIAFPSN